MSGRSVAASHRLVWRWHDDPTSSIDHFAMNVAARPSWAAISFTPFLKTRWRSAVSSALGVRDVDLVLAAAGLALGRLDRDTGPDHLVADATQDVLLARRLEELVVLDAVGVGDEPAPALVGSLLEGVQEQEELELGGAPHGEPALVGPLDLSLQDASGRHLDRAAGGIEQVADDEGRAVQPRQDAGRREVGGGDQVAVAGVPVREPVPGQRVHVDVDREQVVAHLDPVFAGVVEKERAGDPLADRSALDVGEGEDDRVDRAVDDELAERGHVGHAELLLPVRTASSAFGRGAGRYAAFMLRPENWTSPAGASPVRVIAGEPGSRPRSVAERRRAERGVKSLFGGSKRAGRRSTRAESCSLVTVTTGEPSRSCHGEGPRPTNWHVPEMPLVGSPRGTRSGTYARDGSGQERPVWPASSAKTERISQW